MIQSVYPETSKNHLRVGDTWTPTVPTHHTEWDFARNEPVYSTEEPRTIHYLIDSEKSLTNNIKVLYHTPTRQKTQGRCGSKTFMEWIRRTGATVNRPSQRSEAEPS